MFRLRINSKQQTTRVLVNAQHTLAALEDLGSSKSRHIFGWYRSQQDLFSAICSSIIPNFSAICSSSCGLSDSSSLLCSSGKKSNYKRFSSADYVYFQK